MKSILIIIITFFCLEAFSQYQFAGTIRLEDSKDFQDVEVYLITYHIDCVVDSDGKFICTKNTPFDQKLSFLIYKEGYEPVKVGKNYGDGNDPELIEMEKTEKHYITIITKEEAKEVRLLSNVRFKIKEKTFYTDEDGQITIQLNDDRIIDGNDPIIFTLRKEGYEDHFVGDLFYTRGNKLKIIELKKKSKPSPKSILKNRLLWNTENLNVATVKSYCYNNDPSKCEKYGRLYTWKDAKDACNKLGDGWRLPEKEEWQNLALSYGGYSARGLASSNGDGGKGFQNILVDKEINILLGGYRAIKKNKYRSLGKVGHFWTDTSIEDEAAVFSLVQGRIKQDKKHKSFFLSCRCVKDVK